VVAIKQQRKFIAWRSVLLRWRLLNAKRVRVRIESTLLYLGRQYLHLWIQQISDLAFRGGLVIAQL